MATSVLPPTLKWVLMELLGEEGPTGGATAEVAAVVAEEALPRALNRVKHDYLLRTCPFGVASERVSVNGAKLRPINSFSLG